MIELWRHTMQGLLRRRFAGTGSSRARHLAAGVICVAVLALAGRPARAGELHAQVLDSGGQGLTGVVVVAEPEDPRASGHVPRTVVMDQHNMQFVPDVIVIQTGSSVDFPNSDRILHQVYSFSPAKTFQLSLYAGHHYPPIVFDRPGLIIVGCNIHDQMIGYIYVTDSAYFGRTDAVGSLQLHDLPPGRYTVRAWLPGLTGADRRDGVQTQMSVGAVGTSEVSLRLMGAPRRQGAPMSMPMRMDKRWADY